MIELKNCKIEYDFPIVTIEHMCFLEKTLTGIFGESGTGKTSILNLLYGNYPLKDGKYLLNNQPIENIRNFSREHISYIIQQPQFLDDLTCYKNIEIQLNIADCNLSVDEILNIVNLDIDEKIYPPMLSGGQKQKLSLAVAIAKNSKILLCDEPTASLDNESAKEIAHLLQEIAKKLNKIVIVSSHDMLIKDNCDVLYEIKNKKVNCTKIKDYSQTNLNFDEHKSKLSIKTCFSLFFGSYKKYKLTYFIRYCFFALAIMLVVIGLHASTQYTNHYKLYYDFVDKNISYINHSSSNEYYSRYEAPFNDDSIYQFLVNNKDIQSVYSYIPLERTSQIEEISYYLNSENTQDLQPIENRSEFQNLNAFNFIIKEDNHETQIVDPRKDYENFILDEYIAPYYPEMNLQEKCIELINQDGVYITENLSKLLGIDHLKNDTAISFTASVPVTRLYITVENNISFTTIYKNIEIELPIKGIISSRYLQMTSNIEMYIDYEYIQNILNNTALSIAFPNKLEVNKDNINDLTTNGYTNSFINDIIKIMGDTTAIIEFKPYDPSTYFIKTNDNILLSNLLTDLKKIDKEISINNTVESSKATSHIFLSREKFLNIYVIVIFIIIAMLCILYNVVSYKTIKKENKIFHNMGLNKHQITKYHLISTLICWILLVIFSGVFLIFGYILSINTGFIVKAMGYQQAIIKSGYRFIGLTFMIAVFLNIGNIFYDKNK